MLRQCSLRLATPLARPAAASARPFASLSSGDNVAWHYVDAKGQVVGRIATQIATILRGKHKPTFAPNEDCGDYVVVVNANDVVLTGKKREEKMYYWHTGYPGGLKKRTAKEQFIRKPETVLEKAVKGMLPKNRLQALQMKKLRIFAGPEHTHGDKIAGKASLF